MPHVHQRVRKRVPLITEVPGRAGPRGMRDRAEAPVLHVQEGWGVGLGRGPTRGQELVRPESPAGAKEGRPGFLTSFPRCGGHRVEGGRKLKHCQESDVTPEARVFIYCLNEFRLNW